MVCGSEKILDFESAAQVFEEAREELRPTVSDDALRDDSNSDEMTIDAFGCFIGSVFLEWCEDGLSRELIDHSENPGVSFF